MIGRATIGVENIRPPVTKGIHSMSYLLFDLLAPTFGPEAATYWAELLVVDPV